MRLEEKKGHHEGEKGNFRTIRLGERQKANAVDAMASEREEWSFDADAAADECSITGYSIPVALSRTRPESPGHRSFWSRDGECDANNDADGE
jgi:hypothetical protein